MRSVCVAASDLSSTCTRESRPPGIIGITWGLLVPQMLASGLFLNMEGSDVSFTWGEHSRRAGTLLDVEESQRLCPLMAFRISISKEG